MGQKIWSFIKKQWLVVWIVMSVLMLTTLLVTAEYVGENSTMNRVIVSNAQQNTMFSSNILKADGRLYYHAKFESKLSEDQALSGMNYDVKLFLWNYDRMNLSRWYSTDIDYDMTFKLVKKDGTALTAEELDTQAITILKDGVTITTLDKNNLEYNGYSDTLAYSPSSVSENGYIVRFPGDWDFSANEDVCVQIIATPNSNGEDKYRDISELGAIIGLKQLQSMGTSGWEVYLNELRNNSSSIPSDFDGYNLVISGSGVADIVLRIDTNYLSFNRYFYDETFSVWNFTDGEVTYTPPDANGIAKLVIKANSSTNRNTGADKDTNPEYRNRYNIQLYKKAGDPLDWSFISSAENGLIPEGVWITYQIISADN